MNPLTFHIIIIAAAICLAIKYKHLFNTEPLTEKEKELLSSLQQLKANNVWTYGIAHVVQRSSVDLKEFRRLVAELKSHVSENAFILRQALGENIYNQILNI